MADQNFADCYTALGLPADTEWKALRTRYRHLMHQWHPDRFPADSAQHRFAEERSKQITFAYQALERYRRQHGVLPRAAATTNAPQSAEASQQWSRGRGDAHAAARAAESAPPPRDSAPTRRSRWRWLSLFLLVGLMILSVYAVVRVAAPRHDERSVDGPLASGAALARRGPAPATSTDVSRGIFVGSTLGDVYAIQGVPTAMRGDTWYYGNSQIRFSQGAVVSWQEDPDFPLRLARKSHSAAQEATFKVGSTKDDVLAVQGAPVTETATVWDYGLSRIYFQNNRVVHWDESPMQPLRVSR